MKDRDWLWPVGGILAVQLVLWSLAYSQGLAHQPMFFEYQGIALLALVFVLAWRALPLVRARTPIAPLIRDNPRRVLAVVIGIQMFSLGSAAFGSAKAGIPKANPFWLDHQLTAWESAFGIHPWQISHALLGWSTPLIERVYSTFVPGHLAAALFVLTAAPSALKTRALVSLFLIWLILGTGGAYLLSSAGPIFHDRVFGGNTFAGLTTALNDAPMTAWVADQLWAAHANDTPMFGNGISAMPSMHVALTLWLALVVREMRFAWVGWVYLAMIWVGSIHLGWHYASDGLVAIAGVLLIWKATPLLVAAKRPGGLPAFA